jgi:hypothetical protein
VKQVIDLLSLREWFHLIILGSLFPNALLRVSAGRGRILDEPNWISDEWAFVTFILGAILSLLLYNFLTGFFVSLLIMTMQWWLPVDISLLVIYFVIFKKVILGR